MLRVKKPVGEKGRDIIDFYKKGKETVKCETDTYIIIKELPDQHLKEFINKLDDKKKIIDFVQYRTDDLRREKRIYYQYKKSISCPGNFEYKRKITIKQFFEENIFRGSYKSMKKKLFEDGLIPDEMKYIDFEK